MGDHRVNDLSYGHLGEATYDPDEQSWRFQRNDSLGMYIYGFKPPVLTVVNRSFNQTSRALERVPPSVPQHSYR
jgi:hypothetical protein